MHKEGLRNTTILKYISYVRWFLRWASNNSYYSGNLHNTFRPKLKGTNIGIKEVIYLEWEELLELYSFKFPASKTSLPAVRDVFCFCCFTGLRYSDVAKLKKSDVKENYITVITQKTIDSLIIELNKYSRAILKKYEKVGLPNDMALPVISNVKMNEHLKEMGEAVGLNSPQRIVYFKKSQRYEEVLPKYALLTTHCGRRTFIVNALRLGVPAEVIMKWTGHSDYEAMKPYVKIVDKLKTSEMEKFNNFPTDSKPKKKPKKRLSS
jgi:integrase